MSNPRDFDRIQNISPGKHLYQFYRDTSDYLPLMTSFFRAGLAQGHACLWLVAKHVGIEMAYQSLKQQVVELDVYRVNGTMRIMSAEDWY
ncbi:MAG: MEDS domain-containing protein, partial [Candidatus Omnitrophica bacterium]|nr:MEDS domain-containing protein [Candidatus Omnitrophota bacterium]